MTLKRNEKILAHGRRSVARLVKIHQQRATAASAFFTASAAPVTLSVQEARMAGSAGYAQHNSIATALTAKTPLPILKMTGPGAASPPKTKAATNSWPALSH